MCRVLYYVTVLQSCLFLFFFQAEDGIRDYKVTGVQTCALPIFGRDPDSNLFAESESETDRVPHARSGGESVSRVQRVVARGSRWNPEPDRSDRKSVV